MENEIVGQAGAAPAPEAVPISPEQRRALARRYQAQAATKADAFAANVGVLAGDLMLFAGEIAPEIQALLAERRSTPQARKQLAQKVDLFTRCVRDIDRLARFDAELGVGRKTPE